MASSKLQQWHYVRHCQHAVHIAYGQVSSDHYVDMQYFDEGNQSYIDYDGFRFAPNGSYPVDWYFLPSGIFGYHLVSINLGNTYYAKPLIKLVNMRFEAYTSITSVQGSSPNATTAKATVTASLGCPDDNCLHSGDYAVVEIIRGFTGNYFQVNPVGQIRNLPLSLGGAADATFDLTVNNGAPADSYSFTIHILDVKRGSDNSSILTMIQFVPPTAEREKKLMVTN